MNKDNADYLKERMFFLGFGTQLHDQLEKKLAQQSEKFSLSTQGEFQKGENKTVVDYNIDFSKSKQSDKYFVNNYTATLRNDDPQKEVSQKFYLNNGSGVTAKEAFNLLEGRAVHKANLVNKSGEKYEAWMQLNLKSPDDKGNHTIQQYHKAWNYKLEEKLHKLPIEELKSAAQTDQLLKELKKGNLVDVTLNEDGNKKKMFLEANPKDRSITVYDEGMNKQNQGIRKPTGAEKSMETAIDKSTSQQGVDQRGADKSSSSGDLKENKAVYNDKDKASTMTVSAGPGDSEKKNKIGIEIADRPQPKKKGMSR